MPQSILDYISALEDEVKKEKYPRSRFDGFMRLSRAFFLYGKKRDNHEAIDLAIHYVKEVSKFKERYLDLSQILDTLNNLKKAGLYEKLRNEVVESKEADKLSKIYKNLEEREERSQRQEADERANIQSLRETIGLFITSFRHQADLWGLKDYLLGDKDSNVTYGEDLFTIIFIIKNQAK